MISPLVTPTLERFSAAVDAEAGSFQIANAFYTEGRVYALLELMNEDLPHGGVIVEVTLQPFSYRPVLELDDFSLNYHLALGPKRGMRRHWVIEHLGAVHDLTGGAMTTTTSPSAVELSGIAEIDHRSVAIFGENGEMYRIADGTSTRIPVLSNERLIEAHFIRPDLAYVVGYRGAFLEGGVQGFTPVPVPVRTFEIRPGLAWSFSAIAVSSDDDVLLGTTQGPGFIYKSKHHEVVRLEVPDQDTTAVRCIAEFQGRELWGSTEYGLLVRDGFTLVPTFATGGASRMNVNEGMLTLVAGSYVYVFDGDQWIELQFNRSAKRLVEQIPLDFDPAKS